MALTDFFRINMPYGMASNEKGEWMCFNREYKPIGFATTEFTKNSDYPIFVKYKSLTHKKLMALSECEGNHLMISNEKGIVEKIFFYNDKTNPLYGKNYEKRYFKKLEMLFKLKLK